MVWLAGAMLCGLAEEWNFHLTKQRCLYMVLFFQDYHVLYVHCTGGCVFFEIEGEGGVKDGKSFCGLTIAEYDTLGWLRLLGC